MSCYGHNHVGTVHSLKLLLYIYLNTHIFIFLPKLPTRPSTTNSVGMDRLGLRNISGGLQEILSEEFREYGLKAAIINKTEGDINM